MMEKEQRKRHPEKGMHGYFSWEKKKRIAIVILMYGIVLLIYFTGIFRYHTRKNMFTLIAILGILPAAKWTVSMIMALLQKPFSQEAYEATETIAGNLTRGYELCVTAEEGRLALDAVVVCGSARSGRGCCLRQFCCSLHEREPGAVRVHAEAYRKDSEQQWAVRDECSYFSEP